MILIRGLYSSNLELFSPGSHLRDAPLLTPLVSSPTTITIILVFSILCDFVCHRDEDEFLRQKRWSVPLLSLARRLVIRIKLKLSLIFYRVGRSIQPCHPLTFFHLVALASSRKRLRWVDCCCPCIYLLSMVWYLALLELSCSLVTVYIMIFVML